MWYNTWASLSLPTGDGTDKHNYHYLGRGRSLNSFFGLLDCIDF